MKYLIIINPGSKGGSSLKRSKKIIEILDKEKINYDVKMTHSLEDAYLFSIEGNKKGYDVIATVGGDGTINRVINGFFDERGNRISKAKFGVIYTGTSPDFCKSYDIPLETEEATKILLKNKSIKIDIGKVEFCKTWEKDLQNKSIKEAKSATTKYFACCMNIGLGPTLARYANSGIRKKVGDFLGTFLSLLKTLSHYKSSTFMVNTDGKLRTYENTYNISIGKTYYIASGIKVKNDLQQGDKYFYVLGIQNVKARNLISVLKKVYSGKIIEEDDAISLNYNKSIEIYGNNESSEVEFDGDPVGFLPCKVEVAKDPLDVICR